MIKGLLKKDLIMMQGSFKSFPIVVLLYIVIGYFMGNIGTMMGLMAIITAGIASSSLVSDEHYQWDKYVLTMPVSRKQVIQSKFVLLLLTMVPTAILGLSLTALLSEDAGEGILSAVIVLSMFQIMYAITIPCTLQWGHQHARIIMIVGYMFVAVIFLLLLFPLLLIDSAGTQMMDGELATKTIPLTVEMVVAGFALLSAVVTVVAYKVSCEIYENKEF